MMKNSCRQVGILLWMAILLLLCINRAECTNGLVKERNSIFNDGEPAPYHLRMTIEYQDCVDDLFESDLNEDMKVTEEEYVEFILIRSRGGIVGEYRTLPFSLISNFIYGSCFCSFVYKNPNCCVGPDAGINIDPNGNSFIEDNLITICRTTDEAIRNEIGTFPPTPSPTITDSDRPSGSPTSTITNEPSESPTFAPSDAPTSTPTLEPTTIAPTMTPSSTPSTSTPTVAATAPVDPICILFQYSIENDEGLTADDILNGFNNTFIDDLTIATRDTTIRVLNETLPRASERRGLRRDQKSDHAIPHLGFASLMKYELDEFSSSSFVDDENTNGRRRAMYLPSNLGEQTGITVINSDNRRLAFYTDSNPPVILDVIDNDFCAESDEEISCAIVDTKVCVFLDIGDNAEEVKDIMLEGFRNAFQNGSFQGSIPMDDGVF